MFRALPFGVMVATLLPLSLTACATDVSADGVQAADGATFTLQPGESAALADASRLRYVRLINDSRCPPNVQCVWAGDAVVAFQWAPANGAAQAFELHTGKEPRAQAIGGRKVILKSLARGSAPAAELQVDTSP